MKTFIINVVVDEKIGGWQEFDAETLDEAITEANNRWMNQCQHFSLQIKNDSESRIYYQWPGSEKQAETATQFIGFGFEDEE